jgi:hypothetical protein
MLFPKFLGLFGRVGHLYTAEALIKDFRHTSYGGDYASEHLEEDPAGQAVLPLAPIGVLGQDSSGPPLVPNLW